MLVWQRSCFCCGCIIPESGVQWCNVLVYLCFCRFFVSFMMGVCVLHGAPASLPHCLCLCPEVAVWMGPGSRMSWRMCACEHTGGSPALVGTNKGFHSVNHSILVWNLPLRPGLESEQVSTRNLLNIGVCEDLLKDSLCFICRQTPLSWNSQWLSFTEERTCQALNH